MDLAVQDGIRRSSTLQGFVRGGIHEYSMPLQQTIKPIANTTITVGESLP